MAHLRVLRAGPGATIQDGGRFGYRRYGLTPAGPMDWTALRTANLSLGNAADAAAIEIGPGGIELVIEADGPAAIAFCGGGFTWRRNGQLVGAAARQILMPGEVLTAQPGVAGIFTYLAVAGGLRTPVELGSRAAYARTGIGGLDSAVLCAGAVLPFVEGSPGTATAAVPCEAMIVAPWLRPDPDAPLRVVAGPQDDYFEPAARELFFSAPFHVTTGDRMASRLDGPAIAHSRGYNIVSDGVALGAIQIAGDKKPLVLMADHPPTGGYPKLGHVARADIGRLAQLRPGRTCRFVEVSVETARQALLSLENEIAATTNFCRPLHRQMGLSGPVTPHLTPWLAGDSRHPR